MAKENIAMYRLAPLIPLLLILALLLVAIAGGSSAYGEDGTYQLSTPTEQVSETPTPTAAVIPTPR